MLMPLAFAGGVVDLSGTAVLLRLVFAEHGVSMIPCGGQVRRVILVRFLVIFLLILVILLLDSYVACSLRFWLIHSDSTLSCISHSVSHCIHRSVCWATRERLGGVSLLWVGLVMPDDSTLCVGPLRYQPPGSHEGLVEGLLVEGRLRKRIAELLAHRTAGRRTMAEVNQLSSRAPQLQGHMHVGCTCPCASFTRWCMLHGRLSPCIEFQPG